MLSRDERRQLREIELSLAREDPRFVERVTSTAPPDGRALASAATTITVAGCALALFGLLVGSPFAALGVLVATVGFSLRITAQRTTRPRSRPRDDDGGTGHDGALI